MTSRPGPASDDGVERKRGLRLSHRGAVSLQSEKRGVQVASSQKRFERGQEVLAARGVGYPWPEQMARKMLRNVEKRGVHAARNGPSEDGKCWHRLELGIHCLNRWPVKC